MKGLYKWVTADESNVILDQRVNTIFCDLPDTGTFTKSEKDGCIIYSSYPGNVTITDISKVKILVLITVPDINDLRKETEKLYPFGVNKKLGGIYPLRHMIIIESMRQSYIKGALRIFNK